VVFVMGGKKSITATNEDLKFKRRILKKETKGRPSRSKSPKDFRGGKRGGERPSTSRSDEVARQSNQVARK